MSTFTVYIMKGKIKTVIFHIGETTGQRRWLESVLGIESNHTFQIVIEVNFRESSYGSLHIDDISLKSGHCLDCDFDVNFCNWNQYDGDYYGWERHRGNTNNTDTGPSADHTTGDCSDPSPIHGHANSTNYTFGSVVEIKCYHGYILEGESVVVCGQMERWNGTATCIPHDCGFLSIKNGTFITPNGTTFGQVGRQECDNGFVLIGEENVRCTLSGWFNASAYCKMIDCGNLTIPNGIFITPNGTTFGQVGKQECDSGFVLIGEQSITCTVYGWSNTLAYCQMKALSSSGCSFEESFCDWQNINKDKWERINASNISVLGLPSPRPNSDGYFIAVSTQTESAKLIIKTLHSNSACVGLWYSLSRGRKSSIIQVKTSNSKTPDWRISRNSGTDEWNHVLINAKYQIEIEGKVRDVNGYVAIDDIDIATGKTCSADCNFDDGWCAWKNLDKWTRERGGSDAGPISDHTRGDGYYIFTRGSGTKARMSVSQIGDGYTCLTMWYYLHGDNTIKIYMKTHANVERLEHSLKSAEGEEKWTNAQIQFLQRSAYEIIVEGVIENDATGDISIDDIRVKHSMCNQACTPEFINLTISDDLPKGDNSTKVDLYCNNWGNKNLTAVLLTSFDEERYFNVHLENRNSLILEIKSKLKINDWSTYVRVIDLSKNIILNNITFNISSKELNDRPTIQHDVAVSVPENIQVGSIIANISISDPDSDSWGQLNLLYKENEIPEEFELVQVSNNLIEIKTRTALDADKYWNISDFARDINGPIITFTIQVRDGGGLTAVSFVDLTIIDVADSKPICPNDTLRIETKFTNKGDQVANLHLFCVGQNYVSRNVSYYLISDSCKFFDISAEGNLVLQNDVIEIKNCNVTVKASDDVFPQLFSTFSLIIVSVLQTCPNDTDYMKAQWKTGRAGTFSYQKCPNGYEGEVLRYCSESGIYQDPIYNCTKSSINEIYKKFKDKVNNGSVDTDDIIDTLDNLINDTKGNDENESILKGDIDKTLDILSTITDAITVNTTNLENITNSFIANINNILGESTSETWIINVNQTGFGADVVLKNTDLFVEKIMTTNKNVTAEISDTNLYLKLGSLKTCMQALKFPKRDHEGVSEWARSRQDELIIECDGSVESFSGIIYRNISKIMPVTRNSSKTDSLQLNAPVISFTFYPKSEKKVASPVEITFQLYNNTWDNAKCSFWKESQGNSSLGYWSDEGCRQKRDDKNKDIVVCVCDHLTNFAVLMNPTSSKIHEGHKKVLSYISLTGCIISIVCLVLTLAIKAYFWRFIKSVRTIIHINLSCSLLIAYILFLVGINRTENQDVCTAMAVLLHLAFLAVIFGMLTEGCNLSYTVLKPLSTRKPGIPLMIVSYVLAIITVIVSMGVTQLEGYGTEKACWLSTETGLIWAFLVPVLVVVLINAIIVVMVIRTMCSTTAMSKKSSKGRAKATLRCILILMPVMGLTWVFGALSVNEETIIFQYIFAILNSFQGMLIFVFHCLMDKKVKDAFVKQRSKWLQSQSFGVSEGRRLKTQDTSEM